LGEYTPPQGFTQLFSVIITTFNVKVILKTS